MIRVLWLSLLFPLLAWSAEYSGKVIALSDGDTLRVLYQGGQLKVRLAEIDTPEKDQPYGSRARQALSELVFGKVVRVVEQTRDRYGRIVGRVYMGELDVNAEMVRRGAAWVYRRYATDRALYRLEQEARAARRGLWVLPEAERMPPWEWRHGKRAGDPARPGTATQPLVGSTQCGAKRYCREMSSCAEARFYLTQCGLTRLDGDGDGVPCEALCR